MWLKYFLAWLPMIVLAVTNGALRQGVYLKYTGELIAHQISTVTLILFFAVYIHYIIRKFPPANSLQAILVGLMWLLLTVAFEFGFGRMRGVSWSTLLHDYNLADGRIWILIPVWVAIAPYIFFRIQTSR